MPFDWGRTHFVCHRLEAPEGGSEGGCGSLGREAWVGWRKGCAKGPSLASAGRPLLRLEKISVTLKWSRASLEWGDEREPME